MKYGDLKRKIRNLGFAEESDMSDFEENTVADAINQAIADVSRTFPVEDYYTLTISDNDSGLVFVNLEEVGDDFIELSETPVRVNDGNEYTRFTNYDIEMNHTVIIDRDKYKGTFRIYYKRQHQQFTDETPDATELELPLKAHYLVSLLGAYYLWLEDNPSLSATYYDKYQAELNSLVNNEKPKIRARVLDGGI